MLPRRAHRYVLYKCSAWLLSMLGILCLSACSSSEVSEQTDKLNDISYSFHYRNLDSTRIYAERALEMAGRYRDGRAEALNNLAFVHIVRMDFQRAYELLDSIDTDNQVELLIADVQRMRLCQRQSSNKDFYTHRERALRRLNRIAEERQRLNAHQLRRLAYAQSEFEIVASTYFYYIGLEDLAQEAISRINPNGDIEQDTAQLLNYYYNIGSGGIVVRPTLHEIDQVEFDYLMRCYQLAVQQDYPFFAAQAMQSMSEHLNQPERRDELMGYNLPALRYINVDGMPDSLLAGNLAQRALDIFSEYGDVYQTAGAYRTLAECFWEIKDYASAEICLLNALNKDTVINRAPDLVASIREQLCLVYSAVDNKQQSDINRNIYLDIQEQTRQDRQLEARAAQLSASSQQLNLMIGAVIVMIVLVVVLLFVFDFLRRRSDRRFSIDSLSAPLKEWKSREERRVNDVRERYEELQEQTALAQHHILDNRKRNLEQRAKLSVVNSVMPLIDRILHEVRQLLTFKDPSDVRKERYTYIEELTDEINEYNDVLTRWIQMRQGEVSLRIESFPLQDLFHTLSRGRMSFQLKGVELQVRETKDVVKADKTLTLFMLNTMADNARKFTPAGGRVSIFSEAHDDYVEISVEDTGAGMSEEQLAHLFDHQPVRDQFSALTTAQSHGFGLMNCKGIIEKYRKISQIFRVCTLSATSEPGRGTRLSFRLPKGVSRALMLLSFFLMGTAVASSASLRQARAYADSTYYCNINGHYEQTLAYADSCLRILESDSLLLRTDSLAYYRIVLDVRNESAVAALALHQWSTYRHNNRLYTQLFRQLSYDTTLEDHCRIMQRSETNKTVAVVMLVLLLLLIFPAYYMLYYRHRLYYRYSIERVHSINEILLSDIPASEKLTQIQLLWNFSVGERFPMLNKVVEQICEELKRGNDEHLQQQTDLELAEDELKRKQYENDKLYVSNNVLDNCLSTLKHETMYYPSRIRQMIDGTDSAVQLETLSEIVVYYKELYATLSAQAYRQVEGALTIDGEMMRYLFDLLQRLNEGEKPVVSSEEQDSKYIVLRAQMNRLKLTEEECSHLFTPLTKNVQFLLCRQIIRELGEQTNARGCGIRAAVSSLTNTSHLEIEIIITQNIWKSLK